MRATVAGYSSPQWKNLVIHLGRVDGPHGFTGNEFQSTGMKAKPLSVKLSVKQGMAIEDRIRRFIDNQRPFDGTIQCGYWQDKNPTDKLKSEE
jgi:hypothetical protein